jgi:ABC-type transport system involved in cytochrome bd biosynthesis fused ATPase/permease subunit
VLAAERAAQPHRLRSTQPEPRDPNSNERGALLRARSARAEAQHHLKQRARTDTVEVPPGVKKIVTNTSLDRLLLLTMLAIVAILVFARHWRSDDERLTFAFVAFTLIAAFTALAPSKKDRKAQSTRERSEAQLARIADLLEKNPPAQAPASQPASSRTNRLILLMAALWLASRLRRDHP